MHVNSSALAPKQSLTDDLKQNPVVVEAFGHIAQVIQSGKVNSDKISSISNIFHIAVNALLQKSHEIIDLQKQHISRLKNSHQILLQSQDDLVLQKNSLNAKVQDLTNQVGQLVEFKRVVSRENDQLKQELGKNDVKKILSQLVDLEKKSIAQAAEIEALNKEKLKLINEKKKIAKQMKDLKEKSRQASAESKEYIRQNDQLQKNLDEVQKEFEKVQSKLDDIEFEQKKEGHFAVMDLLGYVASGTMGAVGFALSKGKILPALAIGGSTYGVYLIGRHYLQVGLESEVEHYANVHDISKAEAFEQMGQSKNTKKSS